MIAARSEVIATGIAVITEFTHPFADWGINTTDVLFLAVFNKGAFVFRFIEMVMFLNRAVLFNLFGDCSWVFPLTAEQYYEGNFPDPSLFQS